jgi:hypothetical protein
MSASMDWPLVVSGHQELSFDDSNLPDDGQ